MNLLCSMLAFLCFAASSPRATPSRARALSDEESRDENAMHAGSEAEDVATVTLLLQHGANPSARERLGLAPVELASRSGREGIVAAIEAAGASSDSEELSGAAAVVGGAARLREGPSREAPVRAHLPYGTPCRILATHEEWCEIRVENAPELRGFIHRTLLGKPFGERPEPHERAVIKEGRKLCREVPFNDPLLFKYQSLPDYWDGAEKPFLASVNRSFEKWLFWDREAPVHCRLAAHRLLVHQVYGDTPPAVVNQARQFNILGSLFGAVEPAPLSKEIRFEYPKGKQGFFEKMPGGFWLSAAKQGQGGLELGKANGDVALIWTYRIYFGDENPFTFVSRDGELIYRAARAVDVLLVGEDGRLERASATLELRPLDRNASRVVGRDAWELPGSRLWITGDGLEEKNASYVLLAESPLLERIAGMKRIEIAKGKRLSRSEAPDELAETLEIDFDRDGTIDYVDGGFRSAGEAGFAVDWLEAFRVGRSWRARAIMRRWGG